MHLGKIGNMELRNFYRGKKVLITGHTGFKGGWLSMFLKNLGANVIGYSLEPEDKSSSLFEILKIRNILTSEIGDIRDYSKLENVLKKYSPELIFHLAAQPLVRKSYEDPLSTYSTNIMGTVNLLDISNKIKTVKSIINITTDKCYENLENNIPFKEDDKLGGSDPYSSSKACSELVTSSYYKSFLKKQNIGVSTIRAGNVIGGGDFGRDRIIPDFIKSIQKNTSLKIRNPYSIRPWQHVFDALNAYLLVGKKLFENPNKYSESFNISPLEENYLNVEEMINKIIEIMECGEYKYELTENNYYEAKTLKLDSTKASKKLKWMPKYSISESIKETGLWYRKYLNCNEEIIDFSHKQITNYLKKIKY